MKLTKEHLSIIVAAAIAAIVTWAIVRCPDPEPMPTVDTEAIKTEERLRIRRTEVQPLIDIVTTQQHVMDSLSGIKPKIIIHYERIAQVNWNLTDSLSGVLLVTRIRASMPDPNGGKDRKPHP
jgi:hypothetical protein